jgi:hypothetical protein
MLEVGNGGMTEAEYRSHFSIWALAKVHISSHMHLIMLLQFSKFSAFPHCDPGMSCVGSSSDWVRCALDEPGNKGHNQQLRGHRRQPRQVLSSTYLPNMPSSNGISVYSNNIFFITDSLGVLGKKVQSNSGLEVLLNSNPLVLTSMTKLEPYQSKTKKKHDSESVIA